MKMIDKIVQKVLDDADKREDDAAHGGSMNDGGAENRRKQVSYYRYGQIGNIPPDWREYEKEILKEEDPDYAQYMKLKEKFE